jgi:hypothetical protein
MDHAPFRIAATDESHLPVVGKSSWVGGYLSTCIRVEWCWMPPGDGDVVMCHSREVAEACTRCGQGGSVGCRGTYHIAW